MDYGGKIDDDTTMAHVKANYSRYFKSELSLIQMATWYRFFSEIMMMMRSCQAEAEEGQGSNLGSN